MNWISLGYVLCLLQLANAVCECGDGQQSFIPSLVNFVPPSPFNGTDGSPSSFGSTCVMRSDLYVCNNTDNPLFDCSASNNSYYGWDGSQLQTDPISVSLSANFSNHFQSMNILLTFLISTSSNVSAPSSIQYEPFQSESKIVRFVQPRSRANLSTNLPEGPYQHNFTFSRDMMFNGVAITITPNTTFQWVAINRIIFCAAATEDQTSSSSTPLISPSSSMMTPDQTDTSSTGATSLSVSFVMLPTVSSAVSTLSDTMLATMSPTTTTVSPVVSMLPSTVSTIVSTAKSSTMSPTTSSTVSAVTVVSNLPSSDNDDDSVSVAVISGAVVGTLLLIIIIIIIVIIVFILYDKRKKSRAYGVGSKVKLHLHDSNPQQHAHSTLKHDHTDSGALSQLGAVVGPTSKLETVNALYMPFEVKSVVSSLQHDDIIITPNPSYAVGPNSSETGKECEYQYDYVQTDDGSVQHDKVIGATTSGGEYDEVIDPADNVNIDPNPSYSLPQDVKLEDNPSYLPLQDHQDVKLVDNSSYDELLATS